MLGCPQVGFQRIGRATGLRQGHAMEGMEFSWGVRTGRDPIKQLQRTIHLALLQKSASDIRHQFMVGEIVFGDPLEVTQEPLRIPVHAAD